MKVKVRKLDALAEAPRYMSEGASGCDVTACISKPMTIESLERVAVPTGLAVEIPRGYEIQVRPRSGLSYKRGLTVVNAPGTIDSDYRGEVKILLVNVGKDSATIEPGERIAQLVLNRVEQIEWEQTHELESSDRNDGGFGSTGK